MMPEEPQIATGTPQGHPDGCPACVNAVAEPWAVVPMPNGSTREHYECPSCDYRWRADWVEGA